MVAKESQKLSVRLTSMAAERELVDVKFLLRDTSNATKEIVCGEVNAMLDAHERKESVPLTFQDACR